MYLIGDLEFLFCQNIVYIIFLVLYINSSWFSSPGLIILRAFFRTDSIIFHVKNIQA